MTCQHCSAAARSGEHPQCPSVDEWVNRMQNIYIIEYYSALKKSSDLCYEWGNFKSRMLRDRSQITKVTYHIDPTDMNCLTDQGDRKHLVTDSGSHRGTIQGKEKHDQLHRPRA
jgi:hypothetical protein